jgi:hypothetical protein
MAKPYPYPDATPVDEPTAPTPKSAKAKATKGKPVSYPGDVPVDEPTKNYAKGGSIDGCAQRGKTRGKIC